MTITMAATIMLIVPLLHQRAPIPLSHLLPHRTFSLVGTRLITTSTLSTTSCRSILRNSSSSTGEVPLRRSLTTSCHHLQTLTTLMIRSSCKWPLSLANRLMMLNGILLSKISSFALSTRRWSMNRHWTKWRCKITKASLQRVISNLHSSHRSSLRWTTLIFYRVEVLTTLSNWLHSSHNLRSQGRTLTIILVLCSTITVWPNISTEANPISCPNRCSVALYWINPLWLPSQTPMVARQGPVFSATGSHQWRTYRIISSIITSICSQITTKKGTRPHSTTPTPTSLQCSTTVHPSLASVDCRTNWTITTTITSPVKILRPMRTACTNHSNNRDTTVATGAQAVLTFSNSQTEEVR